MEARNRTRANVTIAGVLIGLIGDFEGGSLVWSIGRVLTVAGGLALAAVLFMLLAG